MVKQLPQRAAGLGPPGLLPVNGVQCLVDKEAESAGEGCPPGGHLCSCGAVEDEDERGDDVDNETGHCDQVGSHP